MPDTDFKPERMKPASEDYMERDELHRIYGEAWNQGLWVKELGSGPNGTFMAACGSVYKLQQIEHENPELGDIDVAELMLGDIITISVPGGGITREEACLEAMRSFLEDDVAEPLRVEHDAWVEQVTS
jgi:hypothetical protein